MKAVEFNPVLWGMPAEELKNYTDLGVAPIDALKFWEFHIPATDAAVLSKYGITASVAVTSVVEKAGNK